MQWSLAGLHSIDMQWILAKAEFHSIDVRYAVDPGESRVSLYRCAVELSERVRTLIGAVLLGPEEIDRNGCCFEFVFAFDGF